MIGKQIHSYRIDEHISEGGMGNVFLATHVNLNRKVAIKALNPALAKNQEIRERFKNEAATLSQLQHPNIVQLFDYIEEDDEAYLVMEYVAGKTLDEYIETVTGPIPEEKTIKLFVDILEAVAYAHSKNIVHRDIKPSNFIITDDEKVKILDFGIAKIVGDTSNKLTKTGAKVGTVLYMSPEQVKGEKVNKSTDIYSLGVLLFQLITGKCPYDENSTEFDIYTKIVNEELPPAKQFYIGVSDKIQYVISKATAKSSADRFVDCEDFKEALFAKTIPVKQISPQTVEKKKPIVKKKKRNYLFWLFVPLIVATYVLYLLYTNYQEEELWKNVHSDNNSSAYKEYLVEYPDGKYAPEARSLLNRMKKDSLNSVNSIMDDYKRIIEDAEEYVENQDFDKAIACFKNAKIIIRDHDLFDGNPEKEFRYLNNKIEKTIELKRDFFKLINYPDVEKKDCNDWTIESVKNDVDYTIVTIIIKNEDAESNIYRPGSEKAFHIRNEFGGEYKLKKIVGDDGFENPIVIPNGRRKTFKLYFEKINLMDIDYFDLIEGNTEIVDSTRCNFYQVDLNSNPE